MTDGVLTLTIAFYVTLTNNYLYLSWFTMKSMYTKSFRWSMVLEQFLFAYPQTLAHPFWMPSLTGMFSVADHVIMWFVPALASYGWTLLYVGSGFLLKAARRFDIGFDWFNRKFDIDKKPLSAIGLIAGALVAVVYWAAVIVSRVTHHA